ncbi:hypothetical protein [Azotosporobacter soli]|uniref:hypothetical protein n=1 Tax=Azotosporobacter soli TaxID=3055040 RepID=UPI0031FEA55C
MREDVDKGNVSSRDAKEVFSIRYARVYLKMWGVVIILFVFMLSAVLAGKSSIRTFGSAVDLSQYGVYQLYRIDDSLAFEVGSGYLSLVSYQKTAGIYALAGEYEHAPNEGENVFMPGVDYLKDDYVYSSFPMGKTSIVNLKSGERIGRLVGADVLNGAEFKAVDAAELPEYRKRALLFEERYKLTPEKVRATYPPLDTYNERVFIVEMAFGLVFSLLLLAGIPLFFRRGQENGEKA